MGAFIRQFWPYLLGAAILHGALVVFLVINLDRGVLVIDDGGPPEAIEATVVDEQLVEQELQRIQDAEARRLQEIEEGRRAAEQAAAQRAEEEQRLQALQRQRAQETQQAAERQRVEQQRIERLAREREAAEQAAAEAQRRREAEAARQREEEAARRRAEAERQAREERERRELAQRQVWLNEYAGAIRASVERSWIRPDNWPAGAECTVRVSQIPGGEVVEVRITRSCGSPTLDRSVEDAVLRASPLPRPPDPSVFSREIEFTFRPGN
ncbi:MAG: cell envelope integrity protein TolA [Xanthomonadaceae bacterium]|nr:cell envelope integrity protein TolA [Xanthomonadaceae bacterium]